MLTDADTPTIRFALHRRLDKEPGVEICDIKFQRYRTCDTYVDLDRGTPRRRPVATARAPFLRVGIEATLGRSLITRSVFDLPIPFSVQHLRNEIDEIAEQYKAARKDYFGRGAGLVLTPERQLAGTGTRGRWTTYG